MKPFDPQWIASFVLGAVVGMALVYFLHTQIARLFLNAWLAVGIVLWAGAILCQEERSLAPLREACTNLIHSEPIACVGFVIGCATVLGIRRASPPPPTGSPLSR